MEFTIPELNGMSLWGNEHRKERKSEYRETESLVLSCIPIEYLGDEFHWNCDANAPKYRL
jgi:hypothetical protein